MSEPKLGTYWRHKETGDLYKIIEADGKKWIRRDLPNMEIKLSLSNLHKFSEEKHAKRLMPGQIARIAFEADCALCNGHLDMPRPKNWLSLLPKDKETWIDGRIDFKEPLRTKLYIAVMKVLLEENNKSE